MKLARFTALAGRMWDSIPTEARQGVEALTVEERVLPHPEFADVYTLGECVTEAWPGAFGTDEDTRSELILYYGSFAALAARDPGFEWEEELWETILHELLHHREAAAGESGLEEVDWAEEQNRMRLEGRPFDPGFYRAVPAGSDGVVRLDSSLFLEVSIPADATRATFPWRGRAYTVRVPERDPVSFIDVANLAGGRLCLVVRRRRRGWRLRPAGPARSRPPSVRRSALPATVEV